MSRTHSTRKTPHVALVVGAVAGYGVAIVMKLAEAWLGEENAVGGALLNMAVFGAVIAYLMQMAAYLKIKSIEGLERPYESPLGRAGAIVAALIAAVTLVFLFVNEEFRPGIYGVAIWYALSVVYFAVYARHRMILSPEEEFAEQAGGR